MFFYSAACMCHIGRVRMNNEDNFYFDGRSLPQLNPGLKEPMHCAGILQKPVYFGVFDGMGGEQHGEEAAWLAAKTLKACIDAGGDAGNQVLLSACALANDKICAATKRHADGAIGTTAAMLAFEGSHCWAVNVGDSKAFLFRNGSLYQLSLEHTDQALIEKYGITNRKPRLIQYLGVFPENLTLEPHVVRCEVQRGDQYLLCSDGLTDMLTDAEISGVLAEKRTARQCVERLMQQALERGGKDNVTAILCRVK